MKQVTRFLECDVYEREKCMLQFLNTMKSDWCPILYHYDDTKSLLVMGYCGEVVNASTKPVDLRKQLENILRDLQCFNVQHNDIKEGEILIQDNKVSICDYGWSSINLELGCNNNLWNGKKPCDIFKDNTLFKRLAYLL
jgi:tRNA A-37 threonylcarbamoyl transferase component Bud32